MTDQARAVVEKQAEVIAVKLVAEILNWPVGAIQADTPSVRAITQALQAAVNAERERLNSVVRQLNARAGTSFLNCDEISAYRLACEHVASAIRQPEAREDMRESNP